MADKADNMDMEQVDTPMEPSWEAQRADEHKSAEKALLRARMAALEAELSSLERGVMGTRAVLPSVDSIHHCEVTAVKHNGAFVAIPNFSGSGFIHAMECSRRVIRLSAGSLERNEPSLFAILPNEDPLLHPLHPSIVHHAAATVMTGDAAMEALLPVGRRVWAAVTSARDGHIHLSMRDVDQSTGAPLDYLPASPAAGEVVRGVVAYVHEDNGAPKRLELHSSNSSSSSGRGTSSSGRSWSSPTLMGSSNSAASILGRRSRSSGV